MQDDPRKSEEQDAPHGHTAATPRPSDAHVCPFCAATGRTFVARNALAFAIRDAYPVSPGHSLIVTRRHVTARSPARKRACREDHGSCESGVEATREEPIAVLALADVVKARLDAEGAVVPLPGTGSHLKKSAVWKAEPGTRLRPDVYNLGLNCGAAAGQTVPRRVSCAAKARGVRQTGPAPWLCQSGFDAPRMTWCGELWRATCRG